MWMLDSDICIYVLKRRPARVEAAFQRRSGNIAISTTVLAELEFGAAKSSLPADSRADLAELLKHLQIVPWDEEAARSYGNLRFHLERGGGSIGAMDMMIAAHALSLRSVLVTNNTKHFSRVPGLKLENWT